MPHRAGSCSVSVRRRKWWSPNGTRFRSIGRWRAHRDIVRFLTRALTGERVTDQFETFAVNGFRLSRPPAQPPPIVVAGLRAAQMLDLAGRESDGAVLTCLSADDVGAVVPAVEAAAAAAGREPPDVVAWISVCPSTDAETVRAPPAGGSWAISPFPRTLRSTTSAGGPASSRPWPTRWARGDRRGRGGGDSRLRDRRPRGARRSRRVPWSTSTALPTPVSPRCCSRSCPESSNRRGVPFLALR